MSASLPRILRRVAAYTWAAPNTLIGLLAGLATLCLGGKVRCARGVLEFSGGLLGFLVHALPPPLRFSAITLGHAILGVSQSALEAARRHEHVHVAQYERWGAFFLPAYLSSSLWQLATGRRAYRDNYFERQAYAAEGSMPVLAIRDVILRTPHETAARSRRSAGAGSGRTAM